MKTLKLILLALLMMAGLAANAQTIQIYKDGVVVKEYDAAAVDSVIYKPAEAQPRYYYYAGWECPTTETELANKGTLIGTSLGTYTKSNPLRLFDGEVTNTTVAKYYIVIPNNLHLYDSEGESLVEDVFDSVDSSIPNYKIFISQLSAKRIAGVMIR